MLDRYHPSRWIAEDDITFDDVEYRIIQPSGDIRWIHDRGVLFRDENGQPREVGGIAADITERKQAQHDLECAFEEIQILKDQLQQENIALREEAADLLSGSRSVLHRRCRSS